jgi:hypothetical protein
LPGRRRRFLNIFPPARAQSITHLLMFSGLSVFGIYIPRSAHRYQPTTDEQVHKSAGSQCRQHKKQERESEIERVNERESEKEKER